MQILQLIRSHRAGYFFDRNLTRSLAEVYATFSRDPLGERGRDLCHRFNALP
jgi:hypothetical protein